jgi:hypothetical protein
MKKQNKNEGFIIWLVEKVLGIEGLFLTGKHLIYLFGMTLIINFSIDWLIIGAGTSLIETNLLAWNIILSSIHLIPIYICYKNLNDLDKLSEGGI